MRSLKFWALTASAAAILVACGGGSSDGDQAPKVSFSSMVSFGDSLSDVGNANVGGIKAVGGGKWTVNASGPQNWTEHIAAQLGVSAPCSAVTGLAPNPVLIAKGFTAATTTENTNCLNYAQGSARITNPLGPNSLALRDTLIALGGDGNTEAPLGLTARPITTQIDNYLTAHTAFTGKELVTVMAGGNDALVNLNAISAAATGTAKAVGAATIAGWAPTPAEQLVLSNGGAAASGLAANKAGVALVTAAAQLADYVKTKILANGAKHVIVVNLPDLSTTPHVQALGADAIGLTNNLVKAFNAKLQADLNSADNVIVIDAYSASRDEFYNPDNYKITNATTPACDTALTKNILQGSSIVCNANNTIAGDVSKYLFADTVHPTPYGYQLFAQLVARALIEKGWL